MSASGHERTLACAAARSALLSGADLVNRAWHVRLGQKQTSQVWANMKEAAN